ncbi:hypothetical protein QYM36_002461 [Artemia franciscana]|uniref:tRNA(His) guanylyltransferase n=2 Tax=Artemia franciscana TaxID=6661 RepID=A0AA88IHD4_ARTSF|nr:hypothetical protein QYM36_002461 [Artemia franciscana]CAG4635636.1 EOG090X0AR4 [Artemia franciscana]
MAKSKFEYVREFESSDRCLPNTWMVVRLDGKGFHKFADKHNFEKPNDKNALSLMNEAAKSVMKEFKEITLAYGQSDEFSFLIRRDHDLYNRRSSKISTIICSLFTSAYVFHWDHCMVGKTLLYPPCFDGRVILYPDEKNVRDYFSWRQADCHINNLYNTTFWNLVLKGGITNQQAEERLCKTVSGDKNEILFSQFGINYNNEPEMFRKGTVVYRPKDRSKRSSNVNVEHIDIINDAFWLEHPHLLNKIRE